MANQAQLALALQAAATFNLTVRAQTQGAPVGDYLRDRLSRLLWQQAIEDLAAIILLTHQRHIGSARALVRPQFEALVRGGWIQNCCGEGNLEGVANGTCEMPGLWDAMLAVDGAQGGWRIAGTPVDLRGLADKMAGALHDNVHRGTSSIARVALANMGGEDHIDGAELATLWLSIAFATLAAIMLLEDAGRPAQARIVDRASIEALQEVIAADGREVV